MSLLLLFRTPAIVVPDPGGEEQPPVVVIDTDAPTTWTKINKRSSITTWTSRGQTKK